MAEENLHMDDAFKKMSEEIKAPYNNSFWDDASAKLDDASLDDAFRNAAGASENITPPLGVSESIDDGFLDDAFVDAAAAQSAAYSPAYFDAMMGAMDELSMDEAFQTAAGAVVVDYEPHYWHAADHALQAEGLHHEYNPAYWKEAKAMLDAAEKSKFFFRWSAIATILLLLSFGSYFGFRNYTEGIADVNDIETVDESANTNISAQNIESDQDYQELTHDKEMAMLEMNEFQGNDRSNMNQVDQSLAHSDLNQSQSGSNTSLDDPSNVVTNANDGLNQSGTDLTYNQTSNDQDQSSTHEESETFDFGLSNKAERFESGLLTGIEINEKSIFAPEIEVKKPDPRGDHTWSYYGQIGLGNKYNVQRQIPTWRNSWGIEYMYTPRGSGKLRNWEFGANLLVNHVRQNDLGTERRVKIFGNDGGVAKFWYKLQLKDMFYSNLNAIAAYRFNPKHKIRFGLGLERKLFVQSNMSYQMNGDEKITTVNNNWGIKQGVNSWDVRLSLGYEFCLTHRLSFIVNANYGLLDRTNDAFLQKNIDDHEMSIMGGIKFAIFRDVR